MHTQLQASKSWSKYISFLVRVFGNLSGSNLSVDQEEFLCPNGLLADGRTGRDAARPKNNSVQSVDGGRFAIVKYTVATK
jgi:hypothetical protein